MHCRCIGFGKNPLRNGDEINHESNHCPFGQF
jgi:hypothetical protein